MNKLSKYYQFDLAIFNEKAKSLFDITWWDMPERNGLSSVFISYSNRKLFTGLFSPALIDWKLMVINAIMIAINPANTNTHQPMLMR